MKTALTLFLVIAALHTSAQDKYDHLAYNNITDLDGSNYVIATAGHYGKKTSGSRFLLFINTSGGESRQVDFPDAAYINRIEQVKIDSLGINKVMVIANTVNLDGGKYIDWDDPRQVFLLSPDGKEKVQVTEDKFFVRSWMIKRQTGVIIITGNYDSNDNGKYDVKDKSEILLYDLKTAKLISRI